MVRFQVVTCPVTPDAWGYVVRCPFCGRVQVAGVDPCPHYVSRDGDVATFQEVLVD